MTLLIGLRISRDAGISYFGIDEVNEALKAGKQVVALERGDAMFHKAGEDEVNVRLVLSGFTIKVILSD